MEYSNYGDLLTIVLTLKDRSAFTYRWMRWMEENRCPYKILIADGGLDKEVEEYLKNTANYPSLNYEYIRYPYDNSLSDFYKKNREIHAKVQTKYVVMADNDDFFAIEHFKIYIEFLENDISKEHVSCGGKTTYFAIRDGKNYNELAGKNIDFFEDIRILQHEGATPLDRINYYLECIEKFGMISMIWYHVFRTEFLVQIHQEADHLELSDISFHEFFCTIRMLSFGKIKTLDHACYFRQANSTGNVHLKNKSNVDYLFYTNFISDVKNSVKLLFNAIKYNEETERKIFTLWSRQICKSAHVTRTTFLGILIGNQFFKKTARFVRKKLNIQFGFSKTVNTKNKDIQTIELYLSQYTKRL